ncbi:ABC transporter ATP-binding protein [Mesoterricola sediminis]|uniref:Lipoprotein-releasing system ATP-binding protein LolD n=1 Tax=Mesoterricola sediminis TaxID=2927980 RepID=A0AA48GX68_9BACT|nr:ABC transporter ATP-binding protein [Mesoterricola sediminis]BDU76035.1 lipoprotein-releasing system ATP-binding protein LolD [Mesoterricola sediminis]
MSGASPTPVLRLRGVRKSYGDTVVTEVLHGIDLDIAAGAMTALVGPSGSGKSTLLNLLGLLDRPTAGSIQLQGRETTDLDDAALTELRGRSLGFVFQFHHLLPAFTARENVLLPLHARRGRLDRALWDRAGALLGRMGLRGEIDRLASQLSGGQQQRVAIARALLHDPGLVLADEPTGNLDTVTGREVFDLMRDLNRERGTAFLVVTHDPGLAALCERTIELVDGRVHL